MATIKAIDGRTIHQIQSGQVIVDLCSVVKELLENSLDAAATSIEVRFKDQGLEAIEVQDNGHGVPAQNYASLALKHHTSKLATYADLSTLATFGFRGEALSSLCAVSRFTVTTCVAADVPRGTRLDFAASGQLTATSVVAAQKGTTVVVEGLFHSLPVRRQELERNIKREWTKVTTLLSQYACIQTGVKLTVSQQTPKGRRTVMFSTKGNATTRENIVNVYGARTLAALIPLDLKLALEPTITSGQQRPPSGSSSSETREVRVQGHVSRPAHGEGRQLPDKQMFFVNSRPCALPQFTKAFNEVYKSYNSAQSPFIFANIILDTHAYDVNVSPDKRTILLHDQTRMLEHLKTSLTELFESQDYTIPVSQLPRQSQPSYKQLIIGKLGTSKDVAIASSAGGTRSASSSDAETDDNVDVDVDREEGRDHDADVVRDPSRGLNRPPDVPSINLLSNWAARHAKDRPSATRNTRHAVEQGQSHKVVALRDANIEDEDEEDVPFSPETTSSSLRRKEQEQIVDAEDDEDVHDESGVPSSASSKEQGKPPNVDDDHSTDSSIPIVSPIRPRSLAISPLKGHHTVHPRADEATATVTIGDTTVTSPLGRGRAQYRHQTQSEHRSHARRVGDRPIPSFGSRLSQMFAAPGSRSMTEDVTDGQGQDDEDTAANTTSFGLSNEASSVQDGDIADDPDISHDVVDSTLGVDDTFLPNMSTQEEDETQLEVQADVDDTIPPDGSTEDKTAEADNEKTLARDIGDGSTTGHEEHAQRAKAMLKGGSKRKDMSVNLEGILAMTASNIEASCLAHDAFLHSLHVGTHGHSSGVHDLETPDAEERLSLTISKDDFARMRIVGQFNLGFILATRSPPSPTDPRRRDHGNDLFIIDQHASDEKYNFERLQATTIVQSQRLVHPKTLSLTAIEEELVMDNQSTLERNGFLVHYDRSGESMVGERCKLLSLPLSREIVFTIKDLEELIGLLADHIAVATPADGASSRSPATRPISTSTIPRPSKVRRMHAMRACRSSIMIGRSLTRAQMRRVVRHLGELEQPWNCPHGRPTMRHLCGLDAWDGVVWREGRRWWGSGRERGDGDVGVGAEGDVDEHDVSSASSGAEEVRRHGAPGVDWAGYVKRCQSRQREEEEDDEEDEEEDDVER